MERGTYKTESKGDSSIKSYRPKLFYLGRDEGLIWKIKKNITIGYIDREPGEGGQLSWKAKEFIFGHHSCIQARK